MDNKGERQHSNNSLRNKDRNQSRGQPVSKNRKENRQEKNVDNDKNRNDWVEEGNEPRNTCNGNRRKRTRRRRGHRNFKNSKEKLSNTNEPLQLLNNDFEIYEGKFEIFLTKCPREVLSNLIHPQSGFKEILEFCSLKKKVLILILTAINNAFKTSSEGADVKNLREILIESSLFSIHLPRLLKENANLSSLLKKMEILPVINSVMPIVSRSSLRSRHNFIHFFNSIFERAKGNVDETTLRTLTVLQQSLQLMNIDNEQIPKNISLEYVSFRKISIFPTIQELNSGEVSLSRIIQKGSYKSLNHYLEIHFRLLREDFMFSLRSAFSEYQKHQKVGETQTRYGEANFYTNVKIKLAFFRGKECFKLFFQIPVNEKCDKAERLKYGNLLCISSNKFKIVYFGVIQTYGEDNLPLNEVLIEVECKKMTKQFKEDIAKQTCFSVLESPAYYEAYRHVLSCLQVIGEGQLPFEKHIVYVDKNIQRPAYLKPNSRFKFFVDKSKKNLEIPVFEKCLWPSARELHLDKSQVEALHLALAYSLAIIQGPPGTGKTYIGLKILETLLLNQKQWNPSRSPILIVCYTNHALDQFLEEILNFNENIVRVGGRSLSEKLEEFKLNNIKEKDEEYLQLMNKVNEMKKELEKCEFLLKNKNNLVFHERMLTLPKPDRKILKQFQVLSEQFESKSSLAAWLQVAFEMHEISKLGLKSKFSIANKLVSFKAFDNDLGTEVNSLNTVRCHFEFPKDMERSLLRTLKNPCSLKKNVAVENLKRTDCTSEDEVKRIDDVWNLSLNDRWRLYRRWIAEFSKITEKKIATLSLNISEQIKSMKSASNKLTFDILRNSEVIGMTTSGAARHYNLLKRLGCKIVIVEEAAEVLESHIVTSLNPRTEHLILIGDHQQLKPKPSAYHLAKDYHLDLSLFERLINNGLYFVALEQQHRMRPEISSIIRNHFYPNLRDHERVFNYPDILGVKSNVYFINHSNFEEMATEDSPTYKNTFEAKFLLSLSKYLIRQGYEEKQITILTTYRGQLLTMNSLRDKHKKLTKNLRISTVDNYQGEENEIILLSLVRSNNANQIGFLKEPNRVNVALTRAKHGLFVIGNFDVLANNSELWEKIVEQLKEKNQLGSSLPIVCQKNKKDVHYVSKSEDFNLSAPQGQCSQPCKKLLPCSHECKLLCHDGNEHICSNTNTVYLPCGHPISVCTNSSEYSNKFMRHCKEICKKKLPCGHSCELLCHNGAHYCNKSFRPLLPCGHVGDYINCIGTIMSEYPTCSKSCSVILPCGHICSRKCHSTGNHICNLNRIICLPCNHSVNLPCMTDIESYKCQEIKTEYLSCGKHTITGLCHATFRKKISCSKTEKILLPCGHSKTVPCINRSVYIKESAGYCTEKCGKTLPCGHSCELFCHNGPHYCNKTSSPLLPCGHESYNVKCTGTAFIDYPQCSKICNMILPCGHTCVLSCHKGSHNCDERYKPLLPCGHVCIIQCRGTKLIPYSPCSEQCDIRLPCGHICSRTCHSSGDHTCNSKRVTRLPCQHVVSLPCMTNMKSYKCQELKIHSLSCGKHIITAPCHENISKRSCKSCSKSKCLIS